MSLEKLLESKFKRKKIISMYEFRRLVEEYDGCNERALEIMKRMGYVKKAFIKCMDCGYEGIGKYNCTRCGSDNVKIIEYVFIKS